MSRRAVPFTIALGVVLLLAIGLGGYALTHRGPRGEATPQALMTEYVNALYTGDRARLEQIADPHHDARDEITRQLQSLGRGRLQVDQTSFTRTESADLISATLTGSLDEASFQEQLWLYRRSGRWYVAFGPDKNAHAKPPVA
jgi:hypothetical protein